MKQYSTTFATQFAAFAAALFLAGGAFAAEPVKVETENTMMLFEREQSGAGKTPVSWSFTTIPSETWKNNVGAALLEYAQGTGDWESVRKAFVDGWAVEYQAANDQ